MSDNQNLLDAYGEILSESPQFNNIISSRIDQDKADGVGGDIQRWRMKNVLKDYLVNLAHTATDARGKNAGLYRLDDKTAEDMANQIVDEWDIGFDDGSLYHGEPMYKHMFLDDNGNVSYDDNGGDVVVEYNKNRRY